MATVVSRLASQTTPLASQFFFCEESLEKKFTSVRNSGIEQRRIMSERKKGSSLVATTQSTDLFGYSNVLLGIFAWPGYEATFYCELLPYQRVSAVTDRK